jgi:hypothetical protein
MSRVVVSGGGDDVSEGEGAAGDTAGGRGWGGGVAEDKELEE